MRSFIIITLKKLLLLLLLLLLLNQAGEMGCICSTHATVKKLHGTLVWTDDWLRSLGRQGVGRMTVLK